MGKHTIQRSTMGMTPLERVLSLMGGNFSNERGYMPERTEKIGKTRSIGATVYPSKR